MAKPIGKGRSNEAPGKSNSRTPDNPDFVGQSASSQNSVFDGGETTQTFISGPLKHNPLWTMLDSTLGHHFFKTVNSKPFLDMMSRGLNSAQDRSWIVTYDELEGFLFKNQGDKDGQSPAFFGTKSNDFIYIDPSLGTDGVYDDLILPEINGGGGADQIIMMEAAVINDGFFEKVESVTVLKFADEVLEEEDGEGGIVETYVGSEANLATAAQAAGIREVTGSSSDDVIDFSGYEEPEGYDAGEDPLEIIITGGAGADEMHASFGNDTFIWKTGDMEGTDAENFDKIFGFDVENDTLDIEKLLAGFVDEGFENVEYSISDDGTTTLYIDLDGDGEDHDAEALVELIGVSDSTLVNVIDGII